MTSIYTVYSCSSLFPKTYLKAPASAGKCTYVYVNVISIGTCFYIHESTCVPIHVQCVCVCFMLTECNVVLLCSEFEGLYWAEQKRRKEQRIIDNKRMVHT